MSLNKEIISYIIFGILTTVVNIVCFKSGEPIFNNLLITNVIAWFISVVFAYITNAKFVFSDSKDMSFKQFLTFTAIRLATLVIETILLYVLLDIVHIDSLVSKIISNIIVIVLNFILSKLLVFKSINVFV